jgi:hypothetical protein
MPSNWVNVVEVALLTMGIVMASMVLLVLLLAALRKVSERQSARERAAPPPPVAPPAADPALLAVLTAAAAAALAAPVRVYQIQSARGPERDRWSRAGRMDIMISHRVGPRR